MNAIEETEKSRASKPHRDAAIETRLVKFWSIVRLRGMKVGLGIPEAAGDEWIVRFGEIGVFGSVEVVADDFVGVLDLAISYMESMS